MTGPPPPAAATVTRAAGPALGRLIAAAGAVLDDGTGSPVDRLTPEAEAALRLALGQALAEPGLVPDALVSSPVGRSGVGTYLLHKEVAFTLLCLVTAPGALALTHDHGTWGLVGVYAGLEEEIRYVPVAAPAGEPALVGLAEISRRVFRPGGIMAVEPPPRDVHQVLNRGDVRSVTIHLLGADVVSTGFRTYAPAHLAASTGPLEYGHW